MAAVDARSAAFGWANTDDERTCSEWDEFVAGSERGHYVQHSTFLQSYRSLGLEDDLLVLRSPAGKVVGGCGLLSLAKPGFRVTLAPICPILAPEYDHLANALVDAVVERARERRSSFVQLILAVTDEADVPGIMPATRLEPIASSHPGAVFASGAAPTEMLLLDVAAATDADEWSKRMLAGFSSHHRRVIRRAERSGLVVRESVTESEIQDAFSVITENARLRGYPMRDWDQLGTMIVKQVRSGHAVVITTWHEGSLVGAYYGVIAGRRLTYVFGGIVAEGRDLSAGFLLQWAAMRKAWELGLTAYDLGTPTSPSIMRFKSGFKPRLVNLVEPRHVVFSRLGFRRFNAVYPLVLRHRERARRILSVGSGRS